MQEQGSRELRSHLARTVSSDSVAVTASLEVQSALHRRFRSGEITFDALALSVRELKLAIEDLHIVPIVAGIVNQAETLLAVHPLRTLDALQLAAALSIRDLLNPEDIFLFVASDQKLLEAAGAERLQTWNPERAATPTISVLPVN